MKTSLIAFLTHFLSRFSTPPFLYLPFYPSLFIPPLISAHSLPLSVYLTANTIPSHLTMYLSVHTVNPFVCPSLSSFLHPSIHPCIHPSIQSVCSSTCTSTPHTPDQLHHPLQQERLLPLKFNSKLLTVPHSFFWADLLSTLVSYSSVKVNELAAGAGCYLH